MKYKLVNYVSSPFNKVNDTPYLVKGYQESNELFT